MTPDDYDAFHVRAYELEQARQHREDILAAAAIRAMLCAARGLAESQACHPPGCEQCAKGGAA